MGIHHKMLENTKTHGKSPHEEPNEEPNKQPSWSPLLKAGKHSSKHRKPNSFPSSLPLPLGVTSSRQKWRRHLGMASLHSIVNISLPLCPSEGQAGDHSTCLTICHVSLNWDLHFNDYPPPPPPPPYAHASCEVFCM